MKNQKKFTTFSKKIISKKPRHLESQIQQSIIMYARLTTLSEIRLSDYLISIPNGGARNVLEAARLKREGVKAGVSDLFFAYPVNNYHGLWIEVKTPVKTSNLRETQKEWFDKMLTNGYHCVVVRSLDDFIIAIHKYMKGNKND